MKCGRPYCSSICFYYIQGPEKCAHPENTFIGKTWYGPCQWWVVLPPLTEEEQNAEIQRPQHGDSVQQ